MLNPLGTRRSPQPRLRRGITGCLGVACLGVAYLWGLPSVANLASAEDAGVPPALSQALAEIRAVGPEGAGSAAAKDSWPIVAAAPVEQLPQILHAFVDAGPLAANWLTAAVDSIAERQLQSGGPLPVAELEQLVLDPDQDQRARRQALALLTEVDATAPDRLIPGMLDDPCLVFRHGAIERLINQAEPLDKEDPAAAEKIYVTAFASARDLDQIRLLVTKLRDAGHEIDLHKHFGFLPSWHIIGPFDNTAGAGFAQVYPPEVEINLAGVYDGTTGPVRWQPVKSEDEYAKVELFGPLTGGEKPLNVLAYATTVYESPSEQEVEFRLGSVNATRLWLNGELISSNEVYHAGEAIDQFTARGTLRKGPNVLLLKICQNDNAADWAQDWEFQLRVCDSTGAAILPVSAAAE